jgi:hypothetical protein
LPARVSLLSGISVTQLSATFKQSPGKLVLRADPFLHTHFHGTWCAEGAWSLLKNRLSDNAGAVKYFFQFFTTLLHALREERHFALVAGFALPTTARS